MNKLLKSIIIFSAAALVAGCVEDETMMGYSGHGGYRPVTTASNSYSGYTSHGNSPVTSQSSNGGYQSHGNQPVQRRWHSVARTNTPPVGYQGAVAKSAGSSGAYTYSGSTPSASGYSGR